MSAEDKMTIDERRKYLDKMQKRYRKASRKEKGELLDEMEAVTGQHRKSLIRLLKQGLERQPRKRERGRVYGREEGRVIKVVAQSLDWVCAERLAPSLGWMARHLAAHGELELRPEVERKLEGISISTVRRVLADVPRDRPRLPRGGPERANQLARQIPAGRIPWDELQPGHFEVDLVHHCGPSASGNYVHSLQMVDVATGWSERVAVLGRSYRVMADGFERIQARLPFPVLEVHPDNGSEFLNDHLLTFWKDKFSGLRVSRSRAWYKNDNRFVEQKNDSLVRAYLGYDRLDTVEHTNLLNQLYDKMWLYYNFFQPVMRLESKVALPSLDGRHTAIRRKFDRAQTPFDRLCTSGCLAAEPVAAGQRLRSATNPAQLRRDIYATLDQLFALPLAQPGITQDIFATLFNPPGKVNPTPACLKGEDAPVTLSNELTVALR